VKTIAARNTDVLAGNYLPCNELQTKMLKRCRGYCNNSTCLLVCAVSVMLYFQAPSKISSSMGIF